MDLKQTLYFKYVSTRTLQHKYNSFQLIAFAFLAKKSREGQALVTVCQKSAAVNYDIRICLDIGVMTISSSEMTKCSTIITYVVFFVLLDMHFVRGPVSSLMFDVSQNPFLA